MRREFFALFSRVPILVYMLQNTHTGELAHTYAFSLGREWKLSLAELFSVFGRENYRAHSETIAIFMIKYTESELRTKFRNI